MKPHVLLDKFRTCWGRVEELLGAGELWNDHKKLIFFPRSSVATCTNHLLGVELRFLTGHGVCPRAPV
ncbi:hypothetical protein Taro_017568 [Colocasia esculenta]|uniref:Uncharacterized protein n=1 Tax=Colocasia esculenta TaxID=4460 RepID=A0A843UTL6_COLES|nr:hypothetical protein [Colocasia esculenta]